MEWRRPAPRLPVSGDSLTGHGLESGYLQVDAFEQQGQIGERQLMGGGKAEAAQ